MEPSTDTTNKEIKQQQQDTEESGSRVFARSEYAKKEFWNERFDKLTPNILSIIIIILPQTHRLF